MHLGSHETRSSLYQAEPCVWRRYLRELRRQVLSAVVHGITAVVMIAPLTCRRLEAATLRLDHRPAYLLDHDSTRDDLRRRLPTAMHRPSQRDMRFA